MAEATDDLALARDLDDAARADLQKRIADELEKILEAECDAVLAEYATLRATVEELTRPPLCNWYTTTLHAVSSAIIKLSKLTSATVVFRGVSGGLQSYIMARCCGGSRAPPPHERRPSKPEKQMSADPGFVDVDLGEVEMV